MRGTWLNRILLLVALVLALVVSPLARADDDDSTTSATVTVDCNDGKKINAALARLRKQGPNTVKVKGTCNESVSIDGFKLLTLIAEPGASINDPTPSIPDDNDVVDIFNSSEVTLQGFAINGGNIGVSCFAYTTCRLVDIHVQGAAIGIALSRTSAFILGNSVIENNVVGVILIAASNLGIANSIFGGAGPVIQNNGDDGVRLFDNSSMALTSTIQNNAGDGIDANTGSSVRLANAVLTGNGGNGVRVRASVARFSGSNTINGNLGNGVLLQQLSFATFESGGTTITGNASPDVRCASSTAATVGATTNIGGGTTNCTEPAP